MPRHLQSVFAAVILLLALSGASRADTELSLYTGETSISDTDFDVYYHGSGSVRRQEHFDASSLMGVRLTRWGDDLRWLGGALVAGVTWQFSRHIGLFAEHRYMKFSVDDENESMDWLLGFPSIVTERIRVDMETRQYIGGLSFFF